MKGNEAVLRELNSALQAELSAIVEYMVHGEMMENNGYGKLGLYIQKQARDEMRHAEALIERILYLDGVPQVAVQLTPKIGVKVKDQLANDRESEAEAIVQYNKAVAICAEAGDSGTRDLFEGMVKDEESHYDWLDAQLHVIEEIGVENYLAQQVPAGE
jgi:bacterioferritin